MRICRDEVLAAHAEAHREVKVSDAELVEWNARDIAASGTRREGHGDRILCGNRAVARAAPAFINAHRSVSVAHRTLRLHRYQELDMRAPVSLGRRNGDVHGEALHPLSLGAAQAAKVAPQPVEQFVEGRAVTLKRPAEGNFAQIDVAFRRPERLGGGPASDLPGTPSVIVSLTSLGSPSTL